jgi:dynein heavy chain
LKRIEKLTQDPNMNIARIDTISEAAGGLWRWVLAVEGFAKAFKDIEPKRQTVLKLSEKLKKSKQDLEELKAEFSIVKEKIERLNQNLEKATADK